MHELELLQGPGFASMDSQFRKVWKIWFKVSIGFARFRKETQFHVSHGFARICIIMIMIKFARPVEFRVKFRKISRV